MNYQAHEGFRVPKPKRSKRTNLEKKGFLIFLRTSCVQDALMDVICMQSHLILTRFSMGQMRLTKFPHS